MSLPFLLDKRSWCSYRSSTMPEKVKVRNEEVELIGL
jgi:hypothetical protein